MASPETLFAINDTATESLSNETDMHRAGRIEILETIRWSRSEINKHLGQVALPGLEDNKRFWN